MGAIPLEGQGAGARPEGFLPRAPARLAELPTSLIPAACPAPALGQQGLCFRGEAQSLAPASWLGCDPGKGFSTRRAWATSRLSVPYILGREKPSRGMVLGGSAPDGRSQGEDRAILTPDTCFPAVGASEACPLPERSRCGCVRLLEATSPLHSLHTAWPTPHTSAQSPPHQTLTALNIHFPPRCCAIPAHPGGAQGPCAPPGTLSDGGADARPP